MSSTDPNKLISDKVVDAAAQFIAKQRGISPNDPIVQETLEKLVGVGAKDAEAFPFTCGNDSLFSIICCNGFLARCSRKIATDFINLS